MLESFRNFAGTWFGKALGLLLLIGLAGFGLSGLLGSANTSTLIRVGSKDITQLDFQRAYNAQLSAFEQQTGTVPTPEQALAFGLPTNVLNRLSTEAALSLLGDEMGLGVSDERLGEVLRNDPSFQGALGNFDREQFRLILSRNGLTENQYFKGRREAAAREQLALGLFNNLPAPQAMNDLMYRYGNDRRIVDYVIIRDENMLPVGEPTDEDLTALLTERQEDYRTAETRDINVLVLSPETMADRFSVTDEEAQAEYERTLPSLTIPEKRTVSQLVLPAAATENWFMLGLQNGKTFETLVEESGLAPTLIGTVTKAEITDSRLAEAAFGLEAGKFTLVEGATGLRAVYVSSIEPEGAPSLADIRADIDQRVKLAKARDGFIDLLDQIEEARAAFVSIPDIASQFDLESYTFALTPGGPEFVGSGVIGEEEDVKVADAVFAQDPDRLAPTVLLNATKNVWFDITKVTEPRDQTLDEVREDLAARWVAEARADALAQRAAELAEAASGDGSLEDAAIANGLIMLTSSPFNRGGDQLAGITSSVASLAFGGGVGHADFAQADDGAYWVFKVTEILPSEGTLTEADISLVTSSYRDTGFATLAATLRDDAGMQLNEQLLRQILGLDAN